MTAVRLLRLGFGAIIFVATFLSAPTFYDVLAILAIALASFGLGFSVLIDEETEEEEPQESVSETP